MLRAEVRPSARDAICLAGAAKDMLRMPQRRPSASAKSRSNKNGQTQRLARSRGDKKGHDYPSPNVSDILGEAIRELGMEQALAGREIRLCSKQ